MPVALGVNGGVLGSNNLPSSGSAKGIWTTNEIARAVALGFWPVNYARSITETATGADVISTGANADPYFNYTTLLLSTTATNGQQNNTFQDSSTNNFTITRNPATGPNAPTQGTFSPFSQTGWGNYFNGSSYLSAGTTLFNYTTGNASTTTFTIEAFIYLNSYQSTATVYYNPCIISKGDVYLNLGVNGSGNLIFYHYDGTVRSITGSSVIPLATWTYVAVTVTGGTATLYVNSTSVGSGTWYGIQAAGQNTTSLIGRASTNASSLYFNGYISNLRVSTVARTIATPTTAYTNDANTALLTAQSNRFIDNSSSPITLTVTGTPSVVPFSPFNPTSAWSASTVGGSGYFDGNGDYLTAPSNAAFAVGSVFTIEFWLYPISAGANPVYIYLNETTGSLQFGLNSGNLAVAAAGIAWRLIGSKGPVTNAWNHCVLVRSGTGANQTSIFLNGERIANGTVTDAWTTNVQAIIQSTQGASYLTTGYMSGVRIVKGTAVYDPTLTSLTVPTAPLTAITNTSLLLNFTNAGIYDATSKNDLETVGDAQISNAITPKWGSTSIKFDGTGDYLQAPYQTLSADFGTGQFTIELWVYFSSSVSTTQMFVSSNYNAATGAGGWAFLRRGDNNTIVFTQGANVAYGKTWSPSLNTWYHCAVTRDSSNNLRIFVDGTQVGSTDASVTASINGATSLLIGTNQISPFPLTGYIQDLRITKGYARYTANFTPPTAAFPVQ